MLVVAAEILNPVLDPEFERDVEKLKRVQANITQMAGDRDYVL